MARCSHALEADELAAAKIWDDAMVDVIQSKLNLAKCKVG